MYRYEIPNSYVKAYESYRLTDRQTDMTYRNYTPPSGWSVNKLDNSRWQTVGWYASTG